MKEEQTVKYSFSSQFSEGHLQSKVRFFHEAVCCLSKRGLQIAWCVTCSLDSPWLSRHQPFSHTSQRDSFPVQLRFQIKPCLNASVAPCNLLEKVQRCLGTWSLSQPPILLPSAPSSSYKACSSSTRLSAVTSKFKHTTLPGTWHLTYPSNPCPICASLSFGSQRK